MLMMVSIMAMIHVLMLYFEHYMTNHTDILIPLYFILMTDASF